MHKDLVSIWKKNFYTSLAPNVKSIFDKLYNRLIQEGTQVTIEGEELYTHKLKFHTNDCMYDDSFKRPFDQIDFSSLKEEELWAYIFGEYILNTRINNFHGFGSTQVETY
jgi:hypothetical protein